MAQVGKGADILYLPYSRSAHLHAESGQNGGVSLCSGDMQFQVLRFHSQHLEKQHEIPRGLCKHGCIYAKVKVRKPYLAEQQAPDLGLSRAPLTYPVECR